MPERRLLTLTWDMLDMILNGANARRQKDMVGFRLVAVQVYNAHAEKPLQPDEYLRLPAVDGPPPGPHKVDAAWLARMTEKYGNRLEM